MKISRDKTILYYKILETILFLTFFVWLMSLIVEVILPGFISSHLSFLKISLFASFILIIMSILGKQLEISYEIKIKKWPSILLAIFAFIIVSLSLIKFQLYEITIISIISIVTIFYFYKVLFKEQ